MKRQRNVIFSHIRIFFLACCLLLFVGATVCVDAKIVFRLDSDIYVMNDDGSNKRQLTRNTVSMDLHPRWSPDGKKIAFTRYVDKKRILTTSEVFVMNADGTNLQRLTDNDIFDGHPCWSPDGERIAFQSGRNGEYQVHVIELATRAVTQLTGDKGDHGFTTPDWSPDDTQIAYKKIILNRNSHPHRNIYIMSADGDNPRPLLPDPPTGPTVISRYYPRWSADGQRIAFVDCTMLNKRQTCRLSVMRIGGKARVIKDIYDRLGNNLLAVTPCWMENDRALLFALTLQDFPSRDYDIYRYEFETLSLRRLTQDKRYELDPDWTEGALSVSPHGKLPTQWGDIKQNFSQ